MFVNDTTKSSARPGRRLARTVAAMIMAAALSVGVPMTSTTAVQPALAGVPLSVCAGVSGCKVVKRVDVDGDARADQVGVVMRNLGSTNPGTVTVRVRTATNRLLSTTGTNVRWVGTAADAWAGAAPIDGRRGAELVVGQTTGAHALWFRVITYREGRLVTLRAPKALKRTGQSRGTATWPVDGSYNAQVGVYRTTSKGRAYVRLKSAIRNNSGKGHTGWTVKYRWSGGRWKVVSARKVRYKTDNSAYKIGGWHIKGIPAWG